MFAYVGFYIDGVGGIDTGISQIDQSISLPELIITDLRELIER